MLDIIIILFIIFGGLIGFKQGFTKALVDLVGFVLVFVIAYILKNPLSEILFNILPFFNFDGIIKGVTVLNIVVYESIAFLICYFILTLLLKILLKFTTIFEGILNFTILLGIPSKILGAIIGLIKNYCIIYIILFILCLPVFNEMQFVKDSNLKNKILENTPIISDVCKKSLEITNEFSKIKEKYNVVKDTNQFNLETMDLFLKYDVIKTSTANKLIESNKLKVNGIEKIIEKY